VSGPRAAPACTHSPTSTAWCQSTRCWLGASVHGAERNGGAGATPSTRVPPLTTGQPGIADGLERAADVTGESPADRY
jgi:hypothetical protein